MAPQYWALPMAVGALDMHDAHVWIGRRHGQDLLAGVRAVDDAVLVVAHEAALAEEIGGHDPF